MEDRTQKEAATMATDSAINALSVSRRRFLQGLCAASLAGVARANGAPNPSVCFTIVDHVHQAGVGWNFREGILDGKEYRQAYSIFYSVRKTIDALDQFPWLTACLEFDSHAYEVMQEEDHDFVRNKFRPLVDSGRIDIVGGTYSQPYANLIGWQSNVRQLIEGHRIVREVFDKPTDFFLAEEIFFHPQVPQLLRLCGVEYASLEVQNNGWMPEIRQALIEWEGMDGTRIPTIPHNPWVIPLWKQNQPLDIFADTTAREQGAMLSIWAEVWPPGLDWGASYTPYKEGLESLHNQGFRSLGLTEYMRGRAMGAAQFPPIRYKMDDATLMFGWPQNKGLLWETIGGWGYEGDELIKSQLVLEHKLNCLEQLLSIHPSTGRSERLRQLWKKLMLTQNHDCFIVSGYPGEYEGVATTNLEITKMMSREVEDGIRQLCGEVRGSVLPKGDGELGGIAFINHIGAALRQPVIFEMDMEDGTQYSLQNGPETIPLQILPSDYRNERSRLTGVVDLPPCGWKTFRVKKHAGSARAAEAPEADVVRNEFYSVEWSLTDAAFRVTDLLCKRTFLFRPFSGEITHVTESWWPAPNSGEVFRAKKFSDVQFSSKGIADGPVLRSLSVDGNILTLNTTKDPPAWITARANLFNGVPRIDFFSELHTYPRMKFLAYAEWEFDAGQIGVFRDFPFGEEQTSKTDFSAQRYVRIQYSDFAILIAHGGSQQFLLEHDLAHIRLQNTVARETLKGQYRWQWSMTSGPKFSPAESHRFAEAARGPFVLEAGDALPSEHSWVATSDPAIAIFRVAAEANRLTVWLVNYSGAQRKGELSLGVPARSVRCLNFSGSVLREIPVSLEEKRVSIGLRPWQLCALELDRT